MAVDKSSILPDPPPPNPARRDAAIEAALRRFDGIEEPRQARTAQPTKGWAWLHRPQIRLALTASLIAAIGLPAALIAVREGQFGPTQEAATPAVSRQAPSLGEMTSKAEPPERTPVAPGAETPAQDAQPAKEAKSEAADEARVADLAPPVAAIAPPAPPPPPPPPAAPMARAPSAQKVVSEDQQIVVTGSRIERPNLSAADSLEVAGADARAAPDWVRQDRAYRTFLAQLQSAVRRDDRNAVVRLVAFPLRVNSSGRTRSYRNARSVLDDYDRIFTPQVRQAIVNQRFEQLFGNDQGVMIGDGSVWFDRTCRNSQCSPPGPVRIRAINN